MMRRKNYLLGAVIAALAMAVQTQGAVQNAACLQGNTLDNGSSELAAAVDDIVDLNIFN